MDNISRNKVSAVGTKKVSKINQKILMKSTNQCFFVVIMFLSLQGHFPL